MTGDAARQATRITFVFQIGIHRILVLLFRNAELRGKIEIVARRKTATSRFEAAPMPIDMPPPLPSIALKSIVMRGQSIDARPTNLCNRARRGDCGCRVPPCGS